MNLHGTISFLQLTFGLFDRSYIEELINKNVGRDPPNDPEIMSLMLYRLSWVWLLSAFLVEEGRSCDIGINFAF